MKYKKVIISVTEPPDAEPHVRWCERSAALAVSYSIGLRSSEGEVNQSCCCSSQMAAAAIAFYVN